MDRFNCLRKSAVFIFIVAYVIGGFTQSAPRYTTRHRSNLKCLRSAFVTMNTPRTVLPAADEVAKTFTRREIGAEVDIESSQILALRTNLLLWYRANRRLLPWRGDKIDLPDSSLQKPTTIKINDETIVQKKGQNSSTVTFEKSAYGTWISEIMLQQTRVETVIPYWLKWMARFPSIEVLASASGDEVNAMWAGLGYYRRAQQLLKGAQKVLKDFNGVIPRTVEELKTIDGIGQYTAGAISSIAFNKVEPLVDGNVIRVLSRLYALKESVGSSPMEKVSWAIAAKLVDIESPGDFNQGLMELGATKCKPTSPSCGDCPLSDLCRARILLDHTGRASEGTKITTKESNKKAFENFFSPEKSKTKRKIAVEYEDVSVTAGDSGLSADGFPTSISFFPQKMKKKDPKEILVSVSVIRRKGLSGTGGKGGAQSTDKYLFIRRPNNKGLLANQWEFPNIILSECSGSGSTASADSIPNKGTETNFNLSKDKEEGRGKIKLKAKGKNQDEMVLGREETISKKTLWGPIPGFLRGTLGVEWESEVKQNDGHSSSTAVIIGEVEEEGVSSEGSSKRRRVGKHAIPSQNALAAVESDIVIRVVPLQPCVVLPPLVHIFSHQRHTMHVTLSTVAVRSNRNRVNNSNGESIIERHYFEGVEIVNDTDDFAWESLCGEKREIRWMTANEILKAGITSGCKKILTEVLKS